VKLEDTVVVSPSIVEQIDWFRQRLANADQLRRILLRSGNLEPDQADRDAEMWNAVLATLQAFADLDRKANRPRQAAEKAVRSVGR
jgi:hypothetical protein